MNRGDRVELVTVDDGYRTFAVSAGELGTVDLVDSLGTIHIRWDCGRQFGVITEARDMIRAAPDPGEQP